MSLDLIQRIFLLTLSIGLVPIGLSYGLVPGLSLPWLYGMDISGINAPHIMRSMTGFYLAMAVFWALGALRPGLRLPALWSQVVAMTGVGLGRLVSLAVDGVPHFLLICFMLLEFSLAIVGAYFIKINQKSES